MVLKKFLKKCMRVLKIAGKPGKEEYTTAAKITGIGILVIGTIGFIIYLLSNFPSILGG